MALSFDAGLGACWALHKAQLTEETSGQKCECSRAVSGIKEPMFCRDFRTKGKSCN